MKWYFKIILFFFILVVIIQTLTIIFIPNISNLKQFGFYNKAKYDLLDEKNDTVDTLFIGDSLIYSSLIPVQIWNEYGFTSFDCAIPSQAIDNSLDYLKIGVEAQHPKVVMLETDVLFRTLKNPNRTKNEIEALKNHAPILIFHDNWKQFGSDGFINIYKGHKVNVKSVPVDKLKIVDKSKRYVKIRDDILAYFDEFVKVCNDNNIKLVLIDVPNQKSWNQTRHNTSEKLAQDYKLDFIDLNLEDLGIDWNVDTKDGGEHMNFNGARKVSSYMGKYLSQLNILEDHRNDSKYNDWNKAYEMFLEKSVDEENR